MNKLTIINGILALVAVGVVVTGVSMGRSNSKALKTETASLNEEIQTNEIEVSVNNNAIIDKYIEDVNFHNDKRDTMEYKRILLEDRREEAEKPVVEVEEETVTERIFFKILKENDSSLKEGEERTKRQGKEGIKTIVYEVTLTDDEETNRTIINEEITEEAIDKIIRVGTKEAEPEPKPKPEPEPKPELEPDPEPESEIDDEAYSNIN